MKALVVKWVVIVLLLSVGPAFAQTDLSQIIGDPIHSHTLPVRFGFVNLDNGNLHLEITLYSRPERGHGPTTFTLVYDSTFWTSHNPSGSPYGATYWPGTGGWGGGEGGIDGFTTGAPNTPTPPAEVSYSCPNGGYPHGEIGVYSQQWTYTDSSNTTHNFLLPPIAEPQCYNSQGTLDPSPTTDGNTLGYDTSGSGYALDGSGIFLTVGLDSNDDIKPTVYLPDGTMASGGDASNSGETPNGNTFALWNPTTGIPEDELGVPLNTSAQQPCQGQNQPSSLEDSSPYTSQANVVCTVTIPALNGNTNSASTDTLTTTWEYIPVCTAFNTLTPDSTDYCGGMWVIGSVLLSDGSSYQFSYDQGTTKGHYGKLTGITLPTGGSVSYGYAPYGGSPAAYYGGQANSVSDNGGTTTLAYTNPTSGQNQATYYPVTVHSPAHAVSPGSSSTISDQTVYSCPTQGSSPLCPSTFTTQRYSGTSALVQTITVNVDSADRPTSVATVWNQTGRTETIDYKYADDPSVPGTMSYGGTPINLIAQKQEYDGSTLIRTVRTQYIHDGSVAYVSQYHMIDYPTEYQVFDGAGNLAAQTQLVYDEYSASYCSAGGIAMLGAVTGAAGHDDTRNAAYFARGNVTTEAYSANSGSTVQTHTCYDTTGNVTGTVGSQGLTLYGYADAFAEHACIPATTFTNEFPSVITDQLGHQTKIAYNSCTRGVQAFQDPNDIANGRAGTTHTYDVEGRPLCTTYPDGGQTCLTYPSEATTQTAQLVSPGVSHVVIDDLDGYGNPSNEIDQNAGTRIDYGYDAYGRLQCVSNPYFTAGASSGSICYAYDAVGRSLGQSNPDGSVADNIYTGNVEDVYDETGRHWQRTYDALGRLVQVLEPDASNNPTQATTYQYDALNDLTRVDQWGGPANSGNGDRVRQFAYDWLSRLISSTNPETGTTTYSYVVPNVGSPCSVNPSQPCTKTDARGQTWTFNYDAMGRLVSAGTSESNYAYFYDGSHCCTNYASSNLIGRLGHTEDTTAGSGAGGSHEFGYDAMGRLTLEDNEARSNSYSPGSDEVIATYDLAGDRTGLTYPDGRHVQDTYDSAGRLSSIAYQNWNGTSVSYNYVPSITYGPDGRPTAISFGNGSGEAIAENSRLQPSEISLQMNEDGINQKVADRQYSYTSSCQSADNGNIMTAVDVLNGNRSQGYCYDNLNRIASFASGDGTMQQTFSIDAWGNMNATGTATSSHAFTGSNQIADTGYGYDAAGNMTAAWNGVSTTTFSYDDAGHLSQADSGSATYSYDTLGYRVRKDLTGGAWTEYKYFDGTPMAEKNDDGSWSDYIYAGDVRVARADSYDERIQISGTSNTAGSYAAWYLPFSDYVIQAGDKISWRQYQSGGMRGGIGISFGGSSNTNWSTTDTDGQIMNSDDTENAWHYRTVDLSAFAGKTAVQLWITADASTLVGSWSGWFSDIAIYSANGTVIPIYARQPNESFRYWSGGSESNTQASVGESNTAADAELPSNTTTYYLADQIGSTRLLMAAGGWPLSAEDYYPFGEEAVVPADDNHYKFTGKERDQESGNDYFGARYYASTMGRFLSPDPSGLLYADPKNPQGFNLYSYVANNPLTLIDPNGLWLQLSCYNDPDTVTTSTDANGNTTTTVTAGEQHCTIWDDGQGQYTGTMRQQQLTTFQPPAVSEALWTCRNTILSEIAANIPNGQNAQYMGPTSAPNADDSGMINGAININAFIPGMTSNPTGRYLGGGGGFTAWMSGGGPSLHVPGVNNPGSPDFNSNGDPTNAGPTTVNGQQGYRFTSHSDSSYAYSPFGLFKHYLVDVRSHGSHRPPC